MADEDAHPDGPDRLSCTVSICIPTWNGRHLLEETLPSVLAQTWKAERVVVVDDGSSDDTASWLAATYPTIELVSHPENRGIAAALNSCIAASRGSDYVALLNNDVELAEDAIELLVQRLEADPTLAAAGPKMLNFYDRGLLDGAGDIYCRLGTAHRRGQGDADHGQYDEPGPVLGVCAGAALYRQTALRTVGPFDERFFAYYEDVDWAIRANLAGYRCWYEPRARVFHMSSATVGAGVHEFTGYHCWRNAIWVVAKDWSPRDLVCFSWLLVLGQFGNVLVAARYGLLRTLLRAWRDALRGLPTVVRQRRTVPTRDLSLPWVVLQLNWLRRRA